MRMWPPASSAGPSGARLDMRALANRTSPSGSSRIMNPCFFFDLTIQGESRRRSNCQTSGRQSKELGHMLSSNVDFPCAQQYCVAPFLFGRSLSADFGLVVSLVFLYTSQIYIRILFGFSCFFIIFLFFPFLHFSLFLCFSFSIFIGFLSFPFFLVHEEIFCYV